MRKFRNAAIATATAVSLTFAGTTIAAAQDGDDVQDVQEDSSVRLSSGSSALGHDLGAWSEQDEDEENPEDPIIRDDDQASGSDLLGEETGENPQWAEIWRDFTALGVVGAVVGAVIGGINWLKYQGILPY
ncbi:hypothetical protein [Corynebacterium halotolerans]|uniref:Or membrane protein n=1 Tax=Corynebacterium halotolerans YIM 70093 = DSM 44683 TaxID=1121362 RepID=M1NZ12_9CORY|nr:hypothetical protein [Corynebacterium halotolerans]AGF72755.1 or membrane protein [Corynebacterium halotolerans YIM 70093 = DSM 44683]